MGGELFKSMAKVDVMFIPYNGGPAAIQDLLGGRLDYLFVNTSEATPLVKSGKVRAIGVSSLKRLALMPDVPTLDEAGLKGYETVAWGGVVAPKGTPPRSWRSSTPPSRKPCRRPRSAPAWKRLAPNPPAAARPNSSS